MEHGEGVTWALLVRAVTVSGCPVGTDLQRPQEKPESEHLGDPFLFLHIDNGLSLWKSQAEARRFWLPFAESGELRIGVAQALILRGRTVEPGSVEKGGGGQVAREEGGNRRRWHLESQGQEGHAGLGKMGPGYGFHIQP